MRPILDLLLKFYPCFPLSSSKPIQPTYIMHISTYLITSTLIILSLALNSPPRPNTSPSTPTSSRPPLLHLWPPAPYAHPLNTTALLALEHYGRAVCTNDHGCENNIRSELEEIVQSVYRDYTPAPMETFSFMQGGTSFWLMQEMKTERSDVVKVVSAIWTMTIEWGVVELGFAALIVRGEVWMRFCLMFPGYAGG